MKISYTSPFSNSEIITGGQIYDKDLISIISAKTHHEVNDMSLDGGRWNNNLLLAPFIYLSKVAKDRDTDIFLFNSSYFMRFLLLPFFLKKIKGKKTFAIHHHFMHRQLHGIKKFIYKRFEWIFLNQMDKIVVASPYVYDELLQVYPKEKLLFFKIPFNSTQKYKPRPIKGNLVYTGTIEYRKGLLYLAKALALLKRDGYSYNLTIVGKVIEKEYAAMLEKIINDHNLNVTFTGFLPHEEKDRYLAQSDIFVFPSLLEGYGMALVEAQVYGLPVVSFDNSAMPYNVKNDVNGYAVRTSDCEELAEAIRKIVENRELRQRLSEGAYANLEVQNTYENFEKEIIDNFKNLNL